MLNQVQHDGQSFRSFLRNFKKHVVQKTKFSELSLTDQGRKQSHKTLRVLCFKSFNLLAIGLAFSASQKSVKTLTLNI